MKKTLLLFAFALILSYTYAQTVVTETFSSFPDGWTEGATFTSEHGYEYTLNGNIESPGRRNEGNPAYPSSIRWRAGEYDSFIFSASNLPGGVTSITVRTATFWGTSSTVLRGARIYVNGTEVGTSPGLTSEGTGDAGDNTLGYEDYTVDVDVDGEFTLEIEAVCTSGDCNGETPNLAIAQIEWTTKTTLNSSVQDNALASAVEIYPNPIEDVLNIKQSEGAPITNVELFDATGKSVYKSNETTAINVAGFAKGLYTLNIQAKDGGTMNQKVIVQ